MEYGKSTRSSHLSKVLTFAAFVWFLCSFTVAYADDSLGSAPGFNVFIEGRFQGQYTDVQGRMAAGGNLTLDGYGVASLINLSPEVPSMIAGGDITFDNGQIYAGSVLAAGSAAGLSETVRSSMVVGSSVADFAELPFSFEEEFAQLRQVAKQLSLAQASGTTTYQWGGVYLNGDCQSPVQVFHIEGAKLSSASSLSLECVPEGATIVFNIDGTTPGLQNIGLAHLASRAPKILWNFHQAQTITLASVGIEGSVLAPHADLDTPWGFVNGTVIAKSWVGYMELHHVPFTGDISTLLPSAAPIIVTPPVEIGYEGAPYIYDVDAIDEDVGDVLTHSLDLAPTGFSIDPATGVIDWTPLSEYVGAVPDINDQCYVVPTGSVSVVEEGEALPDGRLAFISPLFKRVKDALEISADYTARESVAWDQRNGCLGCHIQTQSLLGLEASIDKIEVDEAAVDYLLNELFDNQQANGTIVSNAHTTLHLNNQTSLALWALSSFPDRGLTFSARSNALEFFVIGYQTSGLGIFWSHDHNTGWMNNPLPVTALVSQAGAYLLDDLLDPSITFTDTDYANAQAFQTLIPGLAEFFLNGHQNPATDITHTAFRLMGLSELKPHVSDSELLSRVDSAIAHLDLYLRDNTLETGGWARQPGGATASPLASAWVGIALDYLDPELTDPVVINNIEYLLSVQNLASGSSYGTWRDASFFTGPDLAATSLVMSYLPVALDFLGNPDLNLSRLSLTGQGELLHIEGTVSNRGIKETAVASTIHFYAGGDASGLLLGSATVPPLASSASAVVSLAIDDPSVIATDLYAEITVGEGIEECEIRNNNRRSAVVRHRVTDRRGLFDTQIYSLNVEDQNQAPTITSPATFTHQQGQTKSLKVEIADQDTGDAASYSLVGAPAGVFINPRTGQLMVDGQYLEPGEYSFAVHVEDLRGGVAEQELTFTVNENLPPQIISQPVAQKSEGGSYLYAVDAIDPNEDELRYGLEGINTGFTIRNTNGELFIGPEAPLETLRKANEFCQAEPIASQDFTPKLKWAWSGANVLSIPLVAHLIDTNLDGLINDADDTVVVFISHAGFVDGATGVLRVINGNTGEQIWAATAPELLTEAGTHPAIGDIDGDGIPEILMYSRSGGVVALRNDGTLFWRSQMPARSSGCCHYGAINIADIDGDGSVEILARSTVLNADGLVRFNIDQNFVHSTSGLAVDLDLDGALEIVLGNFVYRNDGTLYWQYTEENYFQHAAIGNFDGDDFPEVVMTGNNEVGLFEHDGTLIWKVAIPNNRRFGGAPVVADVDGDGQPEIGVAGSNYYTVYNGDGSVLWSQPVKDFSSSSTGSTVFDFDGDGRSEIIYADETTLRVYDGQSGSVVFSIPNGSATATEYPVVADIDGDDHAELLVVSDSGSTAGVRAFEGINDSWVSTRKIWNQYHYHIDNINDDGSVPQVEQPSWLSHNTYRLNTFTDRAALAQPDLAPFELNYSDQTQTLSAVILNRGAAPSNASAEVVFYSGNPDDGGIGLGAVTVDPMGAGASQTVSLPNIAVSTLADEVFVEIRYTGSLAECITVNNRTSARLVTVSATDEGGLSDTQTFLYSVVNENDWPTITSPSASALVATDSFELNVSVDDIDVGDAHRFSLTEDTYAAFFINPVTGVVRAEANSLQPGVYSFDVVVTDLAGAQAEQIHVVTVSEPDNLPPTFTSTPIASVDALSDYFYTVTASDPDDEVVFLLAEKPTGMTIDGVSGQVFWSPSSAQAGMHVVDITALDARGATSSQRFAIEVIDPQANNRAPTISSQPSGAVIAGKTFEYQVVATDPDGDAVTYSLTSASGNMAITSRGRFSWLPDIAAVGRIFTVDIRVTDPYGAYAIQTLSLPVNEPANTPPVITSTPSASAAVGEEYTYQVVAQDADGDSIAFDLGAHYPNGMSLSSSGLVRWTPDVVQANQVFDVEIIALDARGAMSTQSFGIAVNLAVEPNEFPFFTSVPTSPAVAGKTYRYQAQAQDPDFDPLSFSLASEPLAGLAVSPQGLLEWTPTADQVGEYTVAIKVTDGKASVTQSYALGVQNPADLTNAYPVINSTPATEAIANEVYSYQLTATDPDGDALTFELLSELSDGMSFSSDGLLQWTPSLADVGISNFLVKVSDSQLARTQNWSVKVWDGVPPLRVSLGITPPTVNEGDVVSFSVAKFGGSADATPQLFVDGVELALDNLGNASTVASGFGLHDVRAVATSTADSVEESGQYLVLNPADNVPPVAEIIAPDFDQVVTDAVAIIGTASDLNLAAYEVYLSPVGAGEWVQIGGGSTSVSAGELATLDPTLMVNGQYTILLQVTDVNGQTASDSTVVALDGDLKVGNFSFTVNDLTVPLVGIPIEVSRTYDSRRRFEDLDFGYGWSIDYQNVRVDESRVPGTFWAINQYKRGPFGLIADFCVEPLGAPVITVTLPNGDVERFEVAASPHCSTYQVIKTVDLVFNPVGDTLSTLRALNDTSAYYVNGELVETGYFSSPVNPSRYKLTTQAGYEYFLSQEFGIERVVDPNGHTLTYTDDGIFHSSGKAVTFERSSKGRITDVIAPNGTRLTYHYDGREDLEQVIDRDQSTTRFTYNNAHGLLDIIDPLNRPVLRNLYDENGRLYAQEDGNGQTKTFDHDLDAKTSLVTDRDGRSTLLEYDDKGLVQFETVLIGDGTYSQDIVTAYSYDTNGNQETRTIGDSAWTADFDVRNNQLLAQDPEGNTVFYREHNDRGQETVIEDEMGRVSNMEYDSAGNLYLVEMPAVVDPDTGEATTPSAGNQINAKGLVKSTTDLSGLTTTYTYYPDGHQWEGQKWTESNSISGTTTFTYDDNHNVKTETRQRTVGDAVIEETVSYVYDARDRLTKTTYPDGSYSETLYDLAGDTDKERDRLGNWTDYTYDAYGRLTHTYFADGTVEIQTYTNEGLLETVTDRSGYVTRNEYDDAGRLWKVHNEQDATYTETRYTIQGWVQYEWDEKRNLTEHKYDRAGRRTHTIRLDDNGNELVWSFEYYPNGELHKEIDPLNHTTEYVINELDQRVATLYHNGTTMEERYDLMGRRTATIDQNLRRTSFDYDDLGQLQGVTPEVSINGEPVPTTSYTYDEIGNQLSQTDANNHTTHWTYDYFGRVTSRTLPEGMSETFEYRDAERTVIHTDFNGDTITTVNDALGRAATVTYSKDGREESYTYWPNDQVKTATTDDGVTEYFYDVRHRLDHELRPNGTRMDYDYDVVGNRTLVKVTRGGQVTSQTSYTYDTLNRLDTVTNDLVPGEVTSYGYDGAGNLDVVIYPNGLVTDYDYNSLNQLTDVYTRDALGNVISHYHYALDNTGRRTVVSELDGRTTAYCHDNLYRLSAETVFDTPSSAITEGCLSGADRAGASYTADYEYDWTGNRTYETIDGVQAAYLYDANDRLQQTGGTVYGYDDNGNTLTETLDGATTVYTYNGKNQMVSTEKGGATTGYLYNPNGIRSGRTEGGTTTTFIVDENRDYAQVLEEVVGGAVQVSYSYGHDLISQDRAGATSFYHYDGLGSTRALSNASGSLTDTYDYEAFGEVLGETGTTENNYKFAGEQFDSSLNQYYLRARYYDQGIGRFTQMDTWMGRNFDPITLHKYLYANADPITYVDPTGNFGLGSFGVSFSVQGALTAVSIGSSALNFYSAATDEDGLTAKEVGFSILLAAAGPAGGRLVKLLGNSKSAKKLCDNVCNLLSKSKSIGPAIKFRDPKSINFTQSSIKKNFSDGGSLDDLIANLRSNAVKSDSLPPVRIFMKDGKIFSLDNRRLYAAQQAGVKIKTVGATQDEILREAWKFTTKNGGVSIRVRGQ